MNLYGQKIILRAVEEKDLEILKNLINDPEIENSVVGWSHPISDKQQQEWYQKYKAYDGNNLILGISTFDDNNELIGLISVKGIDFKNRHADSINYKISKQYRGKGFGYEACKIILNFIFFELGLNSIAASVLHYNHVSLALLLKLGFKKIGEKRQCVFKNNTYNNLILLDLLKNDYMEINNEI